MLVSCPGAARSLRSGSETWPTELTAAEQQGVFRLYVGKHSVITRREPIVPYRWYCKQHQSFPICLRGSDQISDNASGQGHLQPSEALNYSRSHEVVA